MQCPPSLAKWMEARKNGQNPKWGAKQSHFTNNWVTKMVNKSAGELAKRVKSTYGKEKIELLSKLYLCKTTSELKVFQKKYVKLRAKRQIKQGWMTDRQIFRLKDVQMVPETKEFRERFLSKLQWEESEDAYNGKVYFYRHGGFRTHETEREDVHELHGHGVVKDGQQWDEIENEMMQFR